MDAPIRDFVADYRRRAPARLHMPGHKGQGEPEALDITEIQGADSLYEAAGIIRRSEENASALFGCPTFYSTEGSSQCVRAMLYLAVLAGGGRAKILAARNVHKSFLTAAALLDLEVCWLWPEEDGSYLRCPLSLSQVEAALRQERPTALYVTSPDYLGNMADIAGLSKICHQYGALLVADGAHGAYLRFLRPSRHPMDLGADLCCASAHKTLPVLTGGAYLHLSPALPERLRARAKDALALFGSTSPSYLILQSLDGANPYLADRYPADLAAFLPRLEGLKERLAAQGWAMTGDEPLKLTLLPKSRGYTGSELGDLLRQRGLECEFSDPDHLVVMPTPANPPEDLDWLEEALAALPRRQEILEAPPALCRGRRVLTIRQAMLAPAVELPTQACVGQVLASPCVGCPPAVPVLVCGEEISQAALEAFRYFGIRHLTVVDR